MWIHGKEIVKFVFLWRDREAVGHLIQLDTDSTTVNIFKQPGAVVSLLVKWLGKRVPPGQLWWELSRRCA